MDALVIYAIAAGGVLILLFLIKIMVSLSHRTHLLTIPLSRHFTLRVLVPRRRLFGPWTWANVCLFISYVAINVFLVLFRARTLAGAGRRAGTLALINFIFPLSTIHASSLADILGIYLRTCQKVHGATSWMGVVLLSVHVVLAIAERPRFLLSESQNLYTTIGAASLGILALLSLPWFRRWSYEVFLRGHQCLTGLFVYGVWRHLPLRNRAPGVYLTIALALCGLNLVVTLLIFLYGNGLFAGHGAPRAVMSYASRESTKANSEEASGAAIKIRLALPRPLKVEAGQYINVWIPGVSLWACTQTHPFMVTSWSRGKQLTLDLLVQPRRGLSKDFLSHVQAVPESSVSFLALFSGPHGISEDVSHCESATVVASGSGIAATIPYLKKMIYGYNTCTSQVRRLHLVWQVVSIDVAISAQDLLNQLLEDDIMDDGYILNISIYVEHGLMQDKLPFGKHQRACLYQGRPHFESLISEEASGKLIERLPNIRDEQGQLLVMVSATDSIRYKLREIVREYLHQRVKLSELEYQPMAD
ncbi:hypothetical protein BDV18DRAFT_148500 [Aspergillus unguis]